MNQKPETMNQEPSSWPAVTCLCPTYGRFERLRDAVACFLLQDYPGDMRFLILNDVGDHPLRLRWSRAVCGLAGIEICNAFYRVPTLGQKRQALLERSDTPLAAHWDDDDLYLPHHLTRAVAALLAHPQARCAKADEAYWATGPRDSWTLQGIRHNVFEGQMVFDRARALELGGYPPLDTGQAKVLLDKFRAAGELVAPDIDERGPSYVYRWGDGLGHVSATARALGDSGPFARANQDFGHGQPLIPESDAIFWARKRLADQFAKLGVGLLGEAQLGFSMMSESRPAPVSREVKPL